MTIIKSISATQDGKLFYKAFFMKVRIGVIEDDNDLRDLIRLSLQNAGCEVYALANGSDLSDLVDNMDLFLIDINLGGESGLDLCRQIKHNQRKGHTPVIIMMSANPDARQLTIEAQGDDLLPKPFTLKELLQKISEYLPEKMVA